MEHLIHLLVCFFANVASLDSGQTLRGSVSLQPSHGPHTVPIHSHGSVMVARIELGRQPLDMVLDTGSSDVWIQKNFAAEDETRYAESASASFEDDGRQYAVQMGSGPIQGTFKKDTMTVGDLDVRNQLFAEVDELPGPLQRAAAAGKLDGFLGLGMKSFSDVHPPTFVESLMQQHVIDTPVFGMQLPRDDSAEGKLTIGGIDNSLYKGELVHIPLTSDTYWQGRLDGVSFGDIKYSAGTVAIDSGTSLLAGPSEQVLEMAKAAGAFPAPGLGGQQLLVDCSKLSELPTLDFSMGGSNFALKPADYVIQAKPDYCIFPFMPMDVPAPRGPLWVLGDLFMRHYYCVFDYGNKRMSIAPAAD